MDALYEIAQCHKNFLDAFALVLSIGSGEAGKLSRFRTGVFGKYYLILNAAKNLGSNSEKTHHTMQLQARGSKLAYTRLSVSHGLLDLEFDEWKTKSIIRKRTRTTAEHINQVTTEYLRHEKVQKDLRQVANMLVDNRRKRSTTPRWEAFSGQHQIAKQRE
jgi:hypothetical protein